MKRKVADSRSGNFRGVCPILNRAAVIPSTVCVMLLARGLWDILRSFSLMHDLVPVFRSGSLLAGLGIFYKNSREHTVECRLRKICLTGTTDSLTSLSIAQAVEHLTK